jgi:hypothetical protein
MPIRLDDPNVAESYVRQGRIGIKKWIAATGDLADSNRSRSNEGIRSAPSA